MEKQRLKEFTSQVSKMYALAMIHIVASLAGIMLNYLGMNNPFVYYAIIFLNLIALKCFEPWQITRYLNEGYGYKRVLESIAQEKKDNV